MKGRGLLYDGHGLSSAMCYQRIYLSIYLYVYLFVCLAGWLLAGWLSIYLSIYLSQTTTKPYLFSLSCLIVVSFCLFASWFALWVEFSADDILKCFLFTPKETGFDIVCRLTLLEIISMQCQILFSWKNKKKKVINLGFSLSRKLYKLTSPEKINPIAAS